MVACKEMARDACGLFICCQVKSKGKEILLIGDLFLLSSRAWGLSSAFLRSLISRKEISPGEIHSHADGTFAQEFLLLSCSFGPFSAPLSRSLLLCRSFLY